MKRKVEIVGMIYGRLTVLNEVERPAHYKNPHRYFSCVCSCGNEKIVQMAALRSGATQSCGCMNREIVSKLYDGKPILSYNGYKTWSGIMDRCFNPRCKDYADYGGRGIAVCARWKDPVSFAEDMGPKPAGYSIERVHVDGNYEPKNCVWASAKQQGVNKRNNHVITVFGEEMTMSDAWQRYGLKESTFYNRLNSGMTPEEAVTKPVRNYIKSQM